MVCLDELSIVFERGAWNLCVLVLFWVVIGLLRRIERIVVGTCWENHFVVVFLVRVGL